MLWSCCVNCPIHCTQQLDNQTRAGECTGFHLCTLCTLGCGPADQREQEKHTQYSWMLQSLAIYSMQESETGIIKFKAEKSYQLMPLWEWTHLLANSMGPNTYAPAKYLRTKWVRKLNFIQIAIASNDWWRLRSYLSLCSKMHQLLWRFSCWGPSASLLPPTSL